jgi:tRNA/rRNA methyltransferase
MNISHAVAIILHSIAGTPLSPPGNRGVATHMELSWLLQHTSDVLEAIDFPAHKRQRVLSNLKRIYGRSELSPKEVWMLRGILRKIELGLRK